MQTKIIKPIMDIDELLKTRYMVVNPFSDCRFNRFYEIITEHKELDWIEKIDDDVAHISLTLPTNKMFLKLKWWEHRKLSDMPKYLKSMRFSGSIRYNDKNEDVSVMLEVKEYLSSGFIDKEGNNYHWDTENFQPVTKEEYDYYQLGSKNYGEYWNEKYKKQQ